jgi:hypothetical protein
MLRILDLYPGGKEESMRMYYRRLHASVCNRMIIILILIQKMYWSG